MTEHIGARSSEECQCKGGMYADGNLAGNCTSCIAHAMECDGFGAPPRPRVGFAFEPTRKGSGFALGPVYRCTTNLACPGVARGGGPVCGQGLDPGAPACGRCLPNHWTDKTVCLECDGGADTLGNVMITLFILCCPILLVVVYKLSNSALTSRTTTTLAAGLAIGSGVTASQMMCNFNLISIEWPGFLAHFFSFLQFFLFDFDVVRWECAFTPTTAHKYFVRTFVPLLVVLSYFAVYLLSVMISKPLHVYKVINSAGTLIQVLFTTIAMNSFVSFQCYAHETGGSSLVTYPAILCGEGDHSAMLGMGTCAVLCTVGMLGMVLYLTLRAPVKCNVDGLYLMKYKFLFFRFRSDRYYFNSIFLLRNFLVGFVTAVNPGDGLMQASLMMIVCVVALSLQMNLWPWREWSLNLMDGVVLSTMAFLAASSMPLVSEAFVNKDTPKVFSIVFVLLQMVAILIVIFSSLFELAVHKNKVHVSTGDVHFAQKLCEDIRRVAQTVVDVPHDEQARTYVMLPKYDLASLREAVGLFAKIYELKDATTTGTARINVGVRQVVAVIHKTSLEGEKMGH